MIVVSFELKLKCYRFSYLFISIVAPTTTTKSGITVNKSSCSITTIQVDGLSTTQYEIPDSQPQSTEAPVDIKVIMCDPAWEFQCSKPSKV